MGDKYEINGTIFDVVVLATGAWLKDILAPLGFDVDVRPAKRSTKGLQSF